MLESLISQMKQQFSQRNPSRASQHGARLGLERLEERALFSVGHTTSSFGAHPPTVPQAISPSNDRAFAALEQLDADTLAYGFWTLEDRSTQSWKDFRTVVSNLQATHPEMEVLAYVGAPSYAGNERFTWEEHLSNEAATDVGRYDDYQRWSREVALLSLEYPIVKGILFDDFSWDMQRDDGITKAFTPAYVESIRQTGRGIAPEFRLEAIQYLQTISAYDAKRFENGLDGVHFFYRHSGESAQVIDPNPDRIATEIEMFRRAYSPDEASPLATIYRPSTKSAKAGDVVSVQATIDLDQVHSDLVIAHYDNIAPLQSSVGWVDRAISFGGDVIYRQDIAADSLDVHEITVTKAQLDAMRAKGIRNAELKMEIEITRSYTRWAYAANIFVSQPEEMPLQWTTSDAKNSNVVVTSNDLAKETDRIVGLYGISPSFMKIDADYSRTILDHARAAYEAGEIEGINVWEVALNDVDSPIFQEYQNYFDAVALDGEYELFFSTSLFENWGGANEKWMRGKNNLWYFILPSGELYEWSGSGLDGRLITTLDPSYHADPQRLFNADPHSNQPPVVSAGADRTIRLPGTATLSGSATDDGLPSSPGRVTTSWSQVSGPGTVTFGNSFAANSTAAFSEAGTYVLRLSANDGSIKVSDEVSIVVEPPPANQPPVVDAGPNQSIQLPNAATLNGTVTDDGLPASPGTVTRTWSKVSGPGTVTFGNASAASTNAQFSVAGTYVLRLTASDGALGSFDELTIQVAPPPIILNAPPLVSAGPDRTVQLPNNVALSGQVTDDGLPNPPGRLTLLWTQVSGPQIVTFSNPTSASTTASFVAAGTYILRLTANDGENAVSDELTVSVTAPPAAPPPPPPPPPPSPPKRGKGR
jgi:hypothetical protein